MRIQPPPVTTQWLGQDSRGKWYIGRLETDGDKKYIVSTADKQRHEVSIGSLRTYH